MYDHNPTIITSRKSVTPLLSRDTHADYHAVLFTRMTDNITPTAYKTLSELPDDSCQFYSPQEPDLDQQLLDLRLLKDKEEQQKTDAWKKEQIE
jgi:hypothetical protein